MSPPDRRLGCGGVAWAAVVGAVVGYLAAAAVDGLADPGHQGAWTTGLVLAGAAALPVAQRLLIRARRIPRGIGWEDVQLALDVVPMLLYLGGLYLAMWVTLPDADGELTVAMACVGVIGWPTFAGTLRVMLHRPVLRPPWWAAVWLFLGVPATASVMSLRSGHLVEWMTAVTCSVLALVPVAVWRFRRAPHVVSTSELQAAVITTNNHASWGRRAAAFLIDAVVLLVLFGLPTGLGQSIGGWVEAVLTTFGVLVGAGLGLGYNRWYLGGLTGQTWGRRVMRLRLVSERTGQPIGWARAFGRDLAHIFTDIASYYIGWLVPLWDARRQTLADKMVHTVVIELPDGGAWRSVGRRWLGHRALDASCRNRLHADSLPRTVPSSCGCWHLRAEIAVLRPARHRGGAGPVSWPSHQGFLP